MCVSVEGKGALGHERMSSWWEGSYSPSEGAPAMTTPPPVPANALRGNLEASPHRLHLTGGVAALPRSHHQRMVGPRLKPGAQLQSPDPPCRRASQEGISL